MRINGKKVIALAITIVMLCLQPAQSLSGTHVEAESRQQYVARLKQFDSVKALEKAGYEPVCDQDGNTADLNQGTGKKAVYLGYVKTKNPEEAITDIAVLDMKGDYIFNDYKTTLQIPYNEIICFTSLKHSVDILTTKDIFKQRSTLNTIAGYLPECFIRCHRSNIVNMKHIYKIEGTTISLSNHLTLQIGRSYLNDVRKAFMAFAVRMR